jgi:hypothetical protein
VISAPGDYASRDLASSSSRTASRSTASGGAGHQRNRRAPLYRLPVEPSPAIGLHQVSRIMVDKIVCMRSAARRLGGLMMRR